MSPIATSPPTPLAHLSGLHLAAAQGAEVPKPTLQQEHVAAQAGRAGRVPRRRRRGDRRADVQLHPAQPVESLDRPHPDRGKNLQLLGAQGPTGLAGAKRVIVAISRGNFYDAEHSDGGRRAPRKLFAHRVRLHRRHRPRVHFAADGVQVAGHPEHRERGAEAGALQAGVITGECRQCATYQAICTPISTATSETSRPSPDNKAIQTSEWPSDLFGDADDTGIDAAMRVAFGYLSRDRSARRRSRFNEPVDTSAGRVRQPRFPRPDPMFEPHRRRPGNRDAVAATIDEYFLGLAAEPSDAGTGFAT
jgi:FMN-dependent NADH-azoreductase